MVVDPVCRMTVDEVAAPFSFEYKGKIYYFCGLGCEERFRKDPEKYLSGKEVDWIAGE